MIAGGTPRCERSVGSQQFNPWLQEDVVTNKRISCYVAGSFAFLTFLVYLPALQNGFVGVWDDNDYVVENPHIRSFDAEFFRWAFFDSHSSNWHPLTWISHAVDYSLWGLNPLGHHLTSIILHSINTALVVVLVLKLLEVARERAIQNTSASYLNDRTVLIAAGVTGLLFGIHPVHVESVAWVAERKDLLCALFFLLSIMAYTKYAVRWKSGAGSQESEGNREDEVGGKNFFLNKHYLLTLGFFVLALLSKPMAVTLPVVLLILDWHPFNRIRSLRSVWSAFAEKLPFIILSLASSIVTILAQRTGDSIASFEVVALSTRVLVAVHSLIAYLGKMLLPLNLVPFYPYPKDVSWFSVEYLLVIGLAIVITAACVILVKKRKLWLSAWGYYVATLIPVLGIVQVGNQAMADRYTYLPSLGPFLAMAFVMARIAEKVSKLRRSGIMRKFIYTCAALCLFFSLSFITFKQITIWENGFVLWDHVIAKGYESATAHNNRGLALDEMGQRVAAIADFERAVALDPRNYFAYNNMGVIYGKEGLFDKSIEYFLKAVALNPRHADSYCNLGLSYFYIHQYDNAFKHYNKAIELKRDFGAAYLNRGNLHFVTGDKGSALADYRKACALGNSRACEAFSLLTRDLQSR